MGPVAAWPVQLLPHVPCRDTQPHQPAATHTPTAPLTAEQLYIVAAALLADGGESFVHHLGPAQIAESIQAPQRDAPHPRHATPRGRTRVRNARLAATLAVAQRGQQTPQWVVCTFSPADAHIVVCAPDRLPGPEAIVRVADCTRMIVKALQEGEHHALLLQVRLKDNASTARPGLWPAAVHPADLELQLAVLTAVYHWLQAFHDLRRRGKPDRQISATHWQAWLQTDAQRDAVQSLRPAPATRALDAAAPGRALATHTVPLANLPFEPVPEGAIRKSVPFPPGARGRRSNQMPPVCRQVLHKRGDAGTPGVARSALCSPGGRQGGGLQHPPREGTEVPVARPVRPAPPAPGVRPRRRRGGGTRSGPGNRRCSPTRVHPRGTGPPGPPVGPAENGLPAPHGPGTPRRPGCPSGPSGNADLGQLTPGGHGGRRPKAPLMEPVQLPRPPRPVPPGHAPAAPGAGGLY